MTNDEMVADLKQFIEATVSQQLAPISEQMATKDDFARLDSKIDSKIDGLRDEMNDRFDEVLNVMGETVNEVSEDFDKKHKNHEIRLLKLETRRA